MKILLTLLALFIGSNTLANSNTIEKQQADFHASYYLHPITQQPEQMELYTKQADQEAFFGVICTDASPFPLIQIVLLNQSIFSETPKLLNVSYQLNPTTHQSLPLQGILKVTDTADEFSNQIRLELKTGQFKNLSQIQTGYQQLLEQLSQSNVIQIQLDHHQLGNRSLHFSLKGLNELLSPYKALCH